MKSIGRVMMCESLEEIVVPGHTALVVWDVHRDFVDTSFNKAEFVKNLTSLLKAARDFYTIVVEDYVSTIDRELHESSLRTLKRVCLVLPSKDIMQAWKLS